MYQQYIRALATQYRYHFNQLYQPVFPPTPPVPHHGRNFPFTIMHTIRALSIIFGFLALGEAVVYFTQLKFPGSIFGMFFLFGALQAGWVKASWLMQLVDVLMANLALFLVPPCVAVMSYLDLIAKDFWSITLATFFSTAAVMFVTGKTHEWLRKR